MLNIENYKSEILNNVNDTQPIFCFIHTKLMKKTDCVNCGECRNKAIEWLCQEYVEPLLSDKEKAYLKNVIEPFGDYAAYVIKFATSKLDFLSIYISVNEEKVRSFEIPLMYDLESMFKNIEYDKEYTLEELGL